jgi:hypothetical protein
MNNQFIIDEISSYFKEMQTASDCFYCEVCKKDYRKNYKSRHLKSKMHFHLLNGKKCENCLVEIDRTSGSQIKLCIDCYKKKKEKENMDRFFNHYKVST